MRLVNAIDPSTLPVANTNAPTASVGTAQNSGLQNQCGALYFMNKSNTGIHLVFEDGSHTVLPAWFARVYKLSNKSNQLWMSQAYTLNTINNPISSLYWEAYQQGEDTTGLYNGPLAYQTNVGNALVQASQVVQTGQPDPTAVLEATPNPSFAAAPSLPEALINNDGSFTLGNAGTLVANQGLALGHDGTGVLTARQYNIGGPGANMPAVSFAGRSPIQLQAGAQETGFCGVDQVAAGAGVTVGDGVNFKTNMTNVPTSITFSSSASGNTSGNGANTFTKFGFAFTITSAGAGRFFNYGTYTTVGN